jgi:hypothetical protein
MSGSERFHHLGAMVDGVSQADIDALANGF